MEYHYYVFEILRILNITQVVSNKDRNPKLGGGYSDARRINPYNPLSYVAILVLNIFSIFYQMGLAAINVIIEIFEDNPFKWH
jgi:hypothetical protein